MSESIRRAEEDQRYRPAHPQRLFELHVRESEAAVDEERRRPAGRQHVIGMDETRVVPELFGNAIPCVPHRERLFYQHREDGHQQEREGAEEVPPVTECPLRHEEQCERAEDEERERAELEYLETLPADEGEADDRDGAGEPEQEGVFHALHAEERPEDDPREESYEYRHSEPLAFR